jgi:hypothetical protein
VGKFWLSFGSVYSNILYQYSLTAIVHAKLLWKQKFLCWRYGIISFLSTLKKKCHVKNVVKQLTRTQKFQKSCYHKAKNLQYKILAGTTTQTKNCYQITGVIIQSFRLKQSKKFQLPWHKPHVSFPLNSHLYMNII